MIERGYAPKLAGLLMAAAVLLCLGAALFSREIVAAAGGLGVAMEYEDRLFDTGEVLSVNILMDEEDWQSLLDNAINEEYVTCDVEIAGETFYRVGVRAKGNTSLSSIVSDPTTDRYSLKLEFDRYVEGQTCFGLDKLILNNSYADATCMKEALVYDMFAALGADASLYNYAKVSVNGEYWGLYLALEAVEDSFLLRNYGTENGELYKPDSMNGGGPGGGAPDGARGGRGGRPDDRESSAGAAPQLPDGAQFPEDGQFPDRAQFSGGGQRPDDAQRPEGGFPDMGGGGMFGGGGASLNYTDDELDSYSTIWEGEVTDSGKADHRRVVTALKNIAQGSDLERYMDIDNLLKYMAVHVFSVNEDSLSGSMAHNYYLYESGGQLNLLPWDYNLAFGGMGRGGDATETVNSPIDDAWSSTNFFDTLLADEDYRAAYYAAMEQVMDYLEDGGFEEFYTRTRGLIDELVAGDPTAFYTYEEYLTAAETLYEAVTLRGQSVRGQLDGTIPSTSDAQRNSDALIDGSHLDLTAMGVMNAGGGFGGRGQEDFEPAQFGGETQGDFDPSRFGGETQERFTPPEFGGERPEGLPGGDAGGGGTEPLILYGLSGAVLLAAFLFALLCRRRPRKR